MDLIEEFCKNYERPEQPRSILKQFFIEIKIKPESYLKNEHDYKEIIKTWWDNHYKECYSTRNGKISYVKIFHEEHDIELSEKFWKKLKKKGRGTRPVTIDRCPTPQEIKRILNHGDLLEKTLVLMFVSSGARIGEILKLEPKHIDWESHKNIMLKITNDIAKNGNPRVTFISNEAKESLIEWLKIRKDWLNVAVKKSKNFGEKNPDDPRIFPFSYKSAHVKWNRMLKKAELTQKDPTTDTYVLHFNTIRKFFNTNMKLELPSAVVECLEGHDGYLDGSYLRYSQKQLAEEYRKGEHRVSIFSIPPDYSEVNESLKEKDNQIKQMQNQLDELKAQIIDLRLEKLEKKNGLN